MTFESSPRNQTQTASQQNRGPRFLTSTAVAILLGIVLCITFYKFKSDSLIGDGLRYLPALRTMLPGAEPTFQPKPWLEVYRNHYDDMVVHNHFLYALTMRAAFALQQELGIPGDATVAMAGVNAISASIAGALFFLLGLRVGLPIWISLAVTLGLCFSPAYLLGATNIAEVGLALPFFFGTFLLLADSDFSQKTAVAAGVLSGLAAITYAVAGALVPSIAAALIIARYRSRPLAKPLLLFLCSSGVVFVGIWLSVLVASGYHSLHRISYAIFHFPQQGTFPPFKLSSLADTAIGLTQGFFPVLPDDFVGMRSLYRLAPWSAVGVGVATLVLCCFLMALFYAQYKRGVLRTPIALSCLLTFLLVEVACAKWDAYYQKLHFFAAMACWLMVLVVLSKAQPLALRACAFLFVSVVIGNGFWVLRNNVQPSQMRANAQRLQAIVGNGELITTWSGDVMHMFLYSNADNIVSLPDLGFARNLDFSEVRNDLDTLIRQTTAQGRNVYFYALFDEKAEKPSAIYETRFRLVGMTAYLSELQRKARPVAHLPQPGNQSMTLYVYVP